METGILIALIVIGIVWWVGAAILCAVVAEEKGRGTGEWFVLGLIFGFVALIALAAMPNTVIVREAATDGSAIPAAKPRLGNRPVDRYLANQKPVRPRTHDKTLTPKQKRRQVSRRGWTMGQIKDRD